VFFFGRFETFDALAVFMSRSVNLRTTAAKQRKHAQQADQGEEKILHVATKRKDKLYTLCA